MLFKRPLGHPRQYRPDEKALVDHHVLGSRPGCPPALERLARFGVEGFLARDRGRGASMFEPSTFTLRYS